MKKTLLAGALVLPLVALGTHLVLRQPPPAEEGLRSGTFEPPREAPAFTLDGSNGEKLSLRDHLGKVVILGFGYTFCEEVCPVTLAQLAAVYKKLGSAAREVQVIYVTVDPERDSPERLREYLAAFHPNFLGATGTPDELAAVQKAYGVVARQVVSRNADLPYAVDHSSSLYLVDRQGKLLGLVPFGTPADDIAHDVDLLLKMRSSPGTSAGVVTQAPQAPAGSVLVNVNMIGFDPESIEVKAGEAIKLAFFRPNDANCAREVIFPELGIRKELPPGQITVVEITPPKSGPLGFECGMKMLKGQLIVR
jgi:protein SCO1/2